ncbi:MAG: hypothetical protein QW041_03055 [Candidatus Pacearchaeota archaeon]
MASLREGDYIKNLVKYAERNLSRGYSVDDIKLALIKQGYSRPAINRAIKIAEANRPKPKVEEKKPEPKVEFVSEEPEKKHGFFARLFGLKKKKEEVVDI